MNGEDDIPVPMVTDADAVLPHNEVVALIAGIAAQVMVVLEPMVSDGDPDYGANQLRNGVIQVLRMERKQGFVEDEHVEWPPLLAGWAPKHRRVFAALVLAIYNN